MRRNFRIGFVLGIAFLLMLLPVYARAQMSLTLTGSGNVNVSGTVVNLSADPGQTISFSITSSLSSPTFIWLAYPNGATGVNTANFSWNTTGVSPGPYMAAFEASSGGEVEQLVAIITINYSTGGSSPPPPTTCTYTYSDWSACQPNNTQTRTVTSINPAGCSGTPILSQSCTYAAPPPPTNGKPLAWNTPTGYVDMNQGQQLTYILNIPTPNTAIAMTIYLVPIDLSTSFNYRFTFPDGRSSSGIVDSYNYAAYPQFRTQIYGYANISDQYLPAGNYTLVLTGNASGRLQVTTKLY